MFGGAGTVRRKDIPVIAHAVRTTWTVVQSAP